MIIKLEPDYPPIFFNKENSQNLDYKKMSAETKILYLKDSVALHNTDLTAWLITQARKENDSDLKDKIYYTVDCLDTAFFAAITEHVPIEDVCHLEFDSLTQLVNSGHTRLAANTIMNHFDEVFYYFLKPIRFGNDYFTAFLAAAGKSGDQKLISLFIGPSTPEQERDDKANKLRSIMRNIDFKYAIIIGLLKGGHLDQAKKLTEDHPPSSEKIAGISLAAIEGGSIGYAWELATNSSIDMRDIRKAINYHIEKVMGEYNSEQFQKILNELAALPASLESELKNKILAHAIRATNNSLEMTQQLFKKYPNSPLYYAQLFTAAEHKNFDTLHYLLTQFSQNFIGEGEEKDDAEELREENFAPLLNLCASMRKYSSESTKKILILHPNIPITTETLHSAVNSGSFETFQHLFTLYLQKQQNVAPENKVEKDILLNEILSLAIKYKKPRFAAQLYQSYSTFLTPNFSESKNFFQRIASSIDPCEFDNDTGESLFMLAKSLGITLDTDFVTHLLIDTNDDVRRFPSFNVFHYNPFALWLISPERGNDKIVLNAESFYHFKHLFKAKGSTAIYGLRSELFGLLSGIINSSQEKDQLLNLQVFFKNETPPIDSNELYSLFTKHFNLAKYILNPANGWTHFEKPDAALFLQAAYYLSQRGERDLAQQIIKPLTPEDLITLTEINFRALVWALETQPETLKLLKEHYKEIEPQLSKHLDDCFAEKSEYLLNAFITRFNLSDQLGPQSDDKEYKANSPRSR